ncbi:hypothetical protein AN944_04065 [Shewanella sp. P1-14-1]|uniref:hypothetical protein n=1 Tax=Shewanella sp. P1-14-1 TaxID=1723761 RepID=UPI0006D68E44|nr:hypothetical protein [Shewanella sp. P1-14-1]KPZ67464.1 hypothetical protein AN944_04065 [Shewanella sp. P1-14-1]
MIDSIYGIWLEFTLVIVLIGIITPIFGVFRERNHSLSRLGYLALLQVILFVLGFSSVISYSRNLPVTAIAVIAASCLLVHNFTTKVKGWQVNTLYLFPTLMLMAVVLNYFSSDLFFSILSVGIG